MASSKSSLTCVLRAGKPAADGSGKNTTTFDGRSNLSRLATLASMGYPGSASSIDSNATLVNPASPPDLSPVEKSILARQETAQRLDELRRGRDSGASAGSGEAPPASATAPYMTSLNPAAAAATAATVAMQSARTEIDPRSGMRVFSANGQIVPNSMQDGPASMSTNGVGANGTSSTAQAQQAQSSQQWQFSDDQMDGGGDMDEGSGEAGPSNYAPNPSAGPSMSLNLNASLLDSPGGSRIRFRGKVASSTPGWAVPPRVLLVDDDLVSRKLFSKFLQVSGCTIDVAVDGIGAVNKMNLEKYDLVLMVSVARLMR